MLKNIVTFNIKLPFIGSAFLWELALTLIWILLAVLAASLSLEIFPMFHGVFMAGSGGGGQIFTLIFFGPIFLFSVTLALLGAGATFSQLRTIYKRSASVINDTSNT